MDLPQRTPHRRFAPSDKSEATALKLGLVLWVTSTYWFKKTHYARDRNMFNWFLFSLGSLFSSVASARFLVESPYAAAASRNNFTEMKQLRLIGHI